MFDEKVKAVLEKAGWYEGRNIDISQQLFVLNDLGFEVFDKAIEFFKQYDQLKIPRLYDTNYSGGTSLNDFNHFNMLMMVQYIYTSKGNERTNRVKALCSIKGCDEKILPIGSLHNFDIPIYITESGKIIGERAVYGNSTEEGIANIILGSKTIGCLPEPYEFPEKKSLRTERYNEFISRCITKLKYSDNQVSWLYNNSLSYSVEVENYLRHIVCAKSLVLIISKDCNEYLYSFYNFDTRLIFSYYSTDYERTKATGEKIFSNFDITDNIRIKVKDKTFSVPDLNFLAYDKHSDKLVIMSGKDLNQNKILIYDLNGDLIKSILPQKNGYFYDMKIDSIGYITVKCNINGEIIYYELNGIDLKADILR
ncbi:MAG: SUKH-3 domain-containing protein [Acutalibacteraceae bacterium]